MPDIVEMADLWEDSSAGNGDQTYILFHVKRTFNKTHEPCYPTNC